MNQKAEEIKVSGITTMEKRWHVRNSLEKSNEETTQVIMYAKFMAGKHLYRIRMGQNTITWDKSHMSILWLIEPKKQDDSWAGPGEHTLHWLQRSTLPRAKKMRYFLNHNLSKLPKSVSSKIKIRLRKDWHSAFFELILSRLLQEIGLEFEYEKTMANGKKPDFLLDTSMGKIIVEATAPVMNARVGEFYKQMNPLIKTIREVTPENWVVLISNLPDIGHNDSKKPFKRLIQFEFNQLPSFYRANELYAIERHLPEGRLKLDMLYKPGRRDPIGIYPGVSYAENSKYRIEYILHKKRNQLKNLKDPVILAIQGSFTGTDYEDFDRVLFGTTFEQFNLSRQLISKGFDPNGLFVDQNPDPTYQGVLAIPNVGFTDISEPVLYLHQQACSKLKNLFRSFGIKYYSPSENRIEMIEPKPSDYRRNLNFVTI